MSERASPSPDRNKLASVELWVDLRHEVASLRLFSDEETARTAETVHVEHRIGEGTGELILRFDDQGRLVSVAFMHASPSFDQVRSLKPAVTPTPTNARQSA